MPDLTIIGGGLAGTECAFQVAERGFEVDLWEMRPERSTPAHKTGDLAELVCSNSLRSDDPNHPAGLLKREMEALGSLVIPTARQSAVAAGGALAVDRYQFSAKVTAAIDNHPRITLRREELTEIPDGPVVIATGPLTSEALSSQLRELLGEQSLYFYDAIAPIVSAESLDLSKMFWGSRYGKGNGDDYLNSPMDQDLYQRFVDAVLRAETAELHNFEAKLFFEGCLPLEEIARRGVQTLCFGPMKPVGLEPPDDVWDSESKPYAVVQLRREDVARTQFNLVGFQTRIKWGDQKRVLRMIPGLESAEFVRMGQVHRNTYINAPRHLGPRYALQAQPQIRFAGQITGVEGYLESSATGLAVGLYLAAELAGTRLPLIPDETALGALARHLTLSSPQRYQPSNINFGLFPALNQRLRKRDRRPAYAARARQHLAQWAATNGLPYHFAVETDSAVEQPVRAVQT